MEKVSVEDTIEDIYYVGGSVFSTGVILSKTACQEKQNTKMAVELQSRFDNLFNTILLEATKSYSSVIKYSGNVY